ncbi:hypothetical protein KUCAC02_017481, partial [Chaenocephalus aceratus]
VNGKFPHCQFYWEMQRAKKECETLLQQQTAASTGCLGEWDNVSCWQSADFNEVKTLPCPSPILRLFGKNGTAHREAGLMFTPLSPSPAGPPPLMNPARKLLSLQLSIAFILRCQRGRQKDGGGEACFGHRRKCGCSDPSRQVIIRLRPENHRQE